MLHGNLPFWWCIIITIPVPFVYFYFCTGMRSIATDLPLGFTYTVISISVLIAGIKNKQELSLS